MTFYNKSIKNSLAAFIVAKISGIAAMILTYLGYPKTGFVLLMLALLAIILCIAGCLKLICVDKIMETELSDQNLDQ